MSSSDEETETVTVADASTENTVGQVNCQRSTAVVADVQAVDGTDVTIQLDGRYKTAHARQPLTTAQTALAVENQDITGGITIIYPVHAALTEAGLQIQNNSGVSIDVEVSWRGN